MNVPYIDKYIMYLSILQIIIMQKYTKFNHLSLLISTYLYLPNFALFALVYRSVQWFFINTFVNPHLTFIFFCACNSNICRSARECSGIPRIEGAMYDGELF